jgi:group I intron endonuclease
MIAGIYTLINMNDGKMYVGKAEDVFYRVNKHFRKLNNNTHINKHLQRAWNNTNEDEWSFSIIEECEYDILDKREIYWIEQLNLLDDTVGYNFAVGGTGGNTLAGFTDQQRKEFGEVSRKRNSGKNNPFYGKTHDATTRKKVSEGNKKFWSNLTEEERKQKAKKSAQARVGSKHSLETRERMSIAAKKRWAK